LCCKSQHSVGTTYPAVSARVRGGGDRARDNLEGPGWRSDNAAGGSAGAGLEGDREGLRGTVGLCLRRCIAAEGNEGDRAAMEALIADMEDVAVCSLVALQPKRVPPESSSMNWAVTRGLVVDRLASSSNSSSAGDGDDLDHLLDQRETAHTHRAAR
jgi:hypothetical protein